MRGGPPRVAPPNRISFVKSLELMAARRVRGFTVEFPSGNPTAARTCSPAGGTARPPRRRQRPTVRVSRSLRAEHGSLIAFDACWRGRSRLPKPSLLAAHNCRPQRYIEAAASRITPRTSASRSAVRIFRAVNTLSTAMTSGENSSIRLHTRA